MISRGDEVWRYVKKGAKKVKTKCKKGARTAVRKVFPRGPTFSRRSRESTPLGTPYPNRGAELNSTCDIHITDIPSSPGTQPPRPVRPPRPPRGLYDGDEDTPLADVHARLLGENNAQQEDPQASSHEEYSPVIPRQVDSPASRQETDSTIASPRSPSQTSSPLQRVHGPSRRVPRVTDPYTTDLLDQPRKQNINSV
ncbi:hypothetical protein TW65_03001 [Stemphylium lycopersici]|nr:hypothetical protein TW65_03001 [Stemphylium lycopersici]